MKYTKEERLKIGQQIYENELTRYEAVEKYDISYNTARDYMRFYRDSHHLPPKLPFSHGIAAAADKAVSSEDLEADLKKYESMSREELIRELVKVKSAAARSGKQMK